jgi:hypothetical protein
VKEDPGQIGEFIKTRAQAGVGSLDTQQRNWW